MTFSSAGTRVACVSVVLLLPAVAAAQRWQVDVGATSIGYDTSGYVGAASIAPQVEWTRGSTYALLNGSVAAFERSGWVLQGWSDLSWLSRPAGLRERGRVEAAASLGGSVHSDGYRTAATRGELRAHFATRTAGVWLGGAAGTGWTTTALGIESSFGPTAGAWLRHRPFTATLLWVPARFRGYWFQELNARLSAAHGPVDVVTYAGWRNAPAGTGFDEEAWVGVTVAAWIAPRAAIVAAAGAYPSDLLQALPRGRYFSIAVRFAAGRASVWAPSWTGRTMYAPEEGGEGVLRFRVPNARRVEVASDWTSWTPVPLERGPDGRWVLRVRLATGVYRFNLVVDGTRWIVPDGFVSVDDGLGGKAGLLVVP